jgi:hypothetical protein
MAKKKSAAKKSAIKADQWKLPVGLAESGEMVSLEEMVAGKRPARSLSALSENQRAELTAERIRLQPNFELGMIGAGIVSKEQAINEVRAKTAVGRTLMEIEERAIQYIIEQAQKGG